MSIKVRKLSSKEYNIYKYIIISIYISNKDKIILIYYKIYIIDDLSTKVLISINIIKLERIILDTNKNLIIISFY